jgi:hypothetical protein
MSRSMRFPVGFAALGGHLDPRLPRQVLAGERARRGHDVVGVPWATTSPPCTPAPGPMSTTWSAARIASSSCSTTITVLPRSRRGERAEQARVVALVQADRGLVEHVHHADQAGADLAGQADALRLAAGQRIGACGRA